MSLPTNHDHMQPLAGKTVVITRAAGRADGLADCLRAYGAQPLFYPTIAHGPPADPAPYDAAIDRLLAGNYDLVVFTSATAVRSLAQRAEARDYDPLALLAHAEPAAVGAATAAVCSEVLGRGPTRIPERFLASELPATLGDLRDRRVLLPNAAIARPELEESLRAAGALLDRVIAYRTVPAADTDVHMPDLLAQGAIDAITFTSGSTAEFFAQKVGPPGIHAAARTIIACIGPSTAAVCRTIGWEPQVIAEVATEHGLADALARYVQSH